MSGGVRQRPGGVGGGKEQRQPAGLCGVGARAGLGAEQLSRPVRRVLSDVHQPAQQRLRKVAAFLAIGRREEQRSCWSHSLSPQG